MSLIAGSYERFVWGFKLKPSKSEVEIFTLSQLFSYPAHLSPVKSVAVSNSVAASSSADDSVKIYDLSSATEIGSLIDHSATVTALSFYTPANLSFPRNLISAAADGSICIYDSDPFVLLQTLTVHKGGINDLAVHPSGRLGLTVGRDSCLGMVNLIRGRRSFYCKLAKEASLVKFGLFGDRFYMAMEEKLSVHAAEDAKIVCEVENRKRVLCATPGQNGLLFTGGEDKSITAWDTNTGKVAYSIEDAHSTRVKGIVVMSPSDRGEKSEDPFLIASASSDGVIRVWDIRSSVNGKPDPLAEVNTRSRLTCLAGSSLKSKVSKKRKIESRKENEDQEEQD
uniref:P21-activated protein kinase-interacting protein 1-like n=1 Tax=Kalanchoe fedtschenkoi TaxID=63787 RepID=A0A7N0RDW0_KALFE